MVKASGSSSHSAKPSSSNNRPKYPVLKNQNAITGTPASALPDQAINRLILQKNGVSKTSPSTSPTQPPAGTVASGSSARQLPSDSDPQSVEADQVPDTPIITKRALDIDAADNVVSFRLAQLNDIGTHIKELPVESFLETLLPPLDSAINLDDLISELKRGRQPTLVKNGWSIFSKARPIERPEIEDKAYADLEKVFETIIKTNPLNKKSFIEYTQTPTLSLSHSKLKLAAKPDGVAYVPLDTLNNRTYPSRDTKDILWGQVVFCGEFKKSDSDRDAHNQVVRQVLGVMCQVMRDEPRRRFVYGFTIENCRMRLWYIDRSEVVVSSPFDIMKKPKLLISFVIALAYAPSLSMLGFDDTCQPHGRKGQFVFDVRDDAGNIRQFYTIQLIHSAAAEAVRGRATRVWAVKEKGGDSGKTLVLKDTWVECTRTREGALMEQIIKDAGPQLKDYLLTVVCHGNVYIDGQADTTRSVNAGYNFKVELPSSTQSRTSAESHHSRIVSGSVADRQSAPEDSKDPVHPTYGQRAHYRIVFEEKGEPLRCVDHLGRVFKALLDITLAIKIMHAAGWVHRDISANNIIWVSTEGRAKLADLEYAKKQHEEPHTYHELRTASQFFIPVEIATNKYMYARPQPQGSGIPPAIFGPQPSYSETKAIVDMHRARPVRHNHLHDLEAVFWIAVYFIWYRKVTTKRVRKSVEDKDPIDQTAAGLAAQRVYAISLFETGPLRRQLALTLGQFTEQSECLHPLVIGTGLEFDKILEVLRKAYRKLERKLPQITISTGCHDTMAEIFAKIMVWMADVSIAPLVYEIPTNEQPATQTNRGHSTSTLNRKLNQVGLQHSIRKAEGDHEAPHPKKARREL